MDLVVSFEGADVTPGGGIDIVAAELLGFYQFKESWDDRDFFIGGDQL